MRSQIPLSKIEAVNVLEAMKMESAFVDWLKEKEVLHHNNYRILFDEGALELLMQFLARRAICDRRDRCGGRGEIVFVDYMWGETMQYEQRYRYDKMLQEQSKKVNFCSRTNTADGQPEH
jgi:hypothetical protein